MNHVDGRTLFAIIQESLSLRCQLHILFPLRLHPLCKLVDMNLMNTTLFLGFYLCALPTPRGPF